jgi:hypothetical protein
MFTGGAALALILALSNTANAQYRGRGNPFASNVYYYQMAAAQQRAAYQAALMQRQVALMAYHQRALAVRQQQQFNALPIRTKQQLAAQVRWQQALELERMRAFLAARRNGNILDGLGNAWQQVGRAGPVGALAAIPLAIATPFALIGGIVQALGGH